MTKRFLKTTALAVMLGWSCGASGALLFDYSGPSTAITDNDPTGVAFNFSISDAATAITSVEVTLRLSAGHNGDVYAFLTHDAGGYAVLLNRSGVGTTTGGSSANGYADTGFNLTFNSAGAANVHFYRNHNPSFNGSGQLTGTWRPDGRAIDPASSPSAFEPTGTADFSTFAGVNPNGNWTLFFADMSPGGLSILEDFSVTLTAVPEPVELALGIFGGLLAAAGVWRWWRARRPAHGKV